MSAPEDTPVRTIYGNRVVLFGRVLRGRRVAVDRYTPGLGIVRVWYRAVLEEDGAHGERLRAECIGGVAESCNPPRLTPGDLTRRGLSPYSPLWADALVVALHTPGAVAPGAA